MPTEHPCVIKEPISLRKLCSQPIFFNKLKSSTNNPHISQKMRYSQIMTSTTGEGRRTTTTDINKIPENLRPKPGIIAPLSNFGTFR